MKVWIVSYFDHEDREASVTCFEEEEPARKCFEHFKTIHQHVAIDHTQVFMGFDYS